MKTVLKRRKHRNGVRPTRKGTLKVNLAPLPTQDEHMQNVRSLMAHREKIANLDEAHEHLNAGRYAAFTRIIRLSKYMSGLIALMQKGYDYFNTHHQVAPIDLLLKVINEEDPALSDSGQTNNPCSTCCLKYKCPYAAFPNELENYCPFKREAQLNKIKDVPNEKDLTVTEMAEQAMKHLS